MASKDQIFYEPGKTDHGLPRDPYKVSEFLTLKPLACDRYLTSLPPVMRRPTSNRLDIEQI